MKITVAIGVCQYSPGLPYYLEYEGCDGVITPRYVMVVSEGRGATDRTTLVRLTANGSRRSEETVFGHFTASD